MPGIAKKKNPPVRILLKKNDQVKVIAGRDRDKTGRVLGVIGASGRVLVEHVNMIKKHMKKNPAKQIAGGIQEKEAPIAVSNVMIVCSKCGPVRIKKHVETLPGGVTRRTRVCHKCGLALDKK
jgi:large subunit ribosomal protein L24